MERSLGWRKVWGACREHVSSSLGRKVGQVWGRTFLQREASVEVWLQERGR